MGGGGGGGGSSVQVKALQVVEPVHANLPRLKHSSSLQPIKGIFEVERSMVKADADAGGGGGGGGGAPEGLASGEASTCNTHGLENAASSQLVKRILGIERPWPALRIGLDAANEMRLALRQGPHQTSQLFSELDPHTDQLEGGFAPPWLHHCCRLCLGFSLHFLKQYPVRTRTA